MKRVFVELHHQMLYKSLQMLFEKRLKFNLFRPIGTEWAYKGYWNNAKVYNQNLDTIKQFLEINNNVLIKTGPKNEVVSENEDYYTIANSYMNERAVTIKQFRKMRPDIVIASYYDNIEPFSKLAKEVGAKFIFQMGNEWPVPWDIVDNLMSSTKPIPVPQGKNAVFYHQEIDLDIYKKGEPKPNSKIIRSFVNCLPEHKIYKQDWLDFQELEKLMPEFKFESYGINCRNGIIKEQQEIADKMRECYFGVHLKNHGDGFGHVIFDFFAVGKPVIYRGSQYADKLAGELMVDMVTGIDIDKHSLTDCVKIIKEMSEEKYKQMCQNAYNKFKEKVNYNKEELLIRDFLGELI